MLRFIAVKTPKLAQVDCGGGGGAGVDEKRNKTANVDIFSTFARDATVSINICLGCVRQIIVPSMSCAETR